MADKVTMLFRPRNPMQVAYKLQPGNNKTKFKKKLNCRKMYTQRYEVTIIDTGVIPRHSLFWGRVWWGTMATALGGGRAKNIRLDDWNPPQPIISRLFFDITIGEQAQ